jgi:sugar phosphate isomerase/epimerase
MKLAAITDEISQDFEHALDVLAEYGIAAAELRGLWGTNIADLTPEQVERARTALSARGFTVACLATPFYKCDLESEADQPAERGPLHLAPARGLEQQFALLQRCIQLAHAFDTRLIRVFAFWRKSALTPEIEERIAEAFAAPVALAAQEGVTLVLENEHACMIGSGAEAAHLLAKVNSPHLKACWDPGNAFSLGERAYPDGYEAVRPWVAHVHVKDGNMVDTPDHGKQARFCVLGEGEIDYAGQFAALERDGYQGYVSLETHYVPQHGSGPDGRGTPEDGSRPCLAYLRKVADSFAAHS